MIQDPPYNLHQTVFVRRVLDFFENHLPQRPDFEDRPEQRRMAAAVAQAIENEEVLVVEAGTGTGKSLAYLIPAFLWARDRGGPVIISTRTLNLQQQLLQKDIPALHELLHEPFRAIPARGWSNYVCLRRLHHIPGSGLVDYAGEREASELIATLDETGLKQDLRVSDNLWGHICCESTACNRQACQFYAQCYLFRERRQLDTADLIITNHSLLLADLQLRRNGAQGILPKPVALVIDEGHHLEEVANEHLACTFGYQHLHRLKAQLLQGEQGFLPSLRSRIAAIPLEAEAKRKLLAIVDRELVAQSSDLQSAGDQFFELVAAAVDGRVTLTRDFPTTEFGKQLLEVAARLNGWMERVQSGLVSLSRALEEEEAPGMEGAVVELKGLADRLGGHRSDLEFCLFPDSSDWVYWASAPPFSKEKRAGAQDAMLGATPLDVGETLAKDFFQPARSVIVTSATLAVGDDLSFFEQRTGLDGVEDRIQRLTLDSPFDFSHQAYLGVATDLGEPGSAEFFDKCIPSLTRLVLDLRGRTFLLLTSYQVLRKAQQMLAPRLEPYGIRILAQGEAPNAQLLESFREQGEALLLGTDSFWEGVDVPGDALQCVILGRLPFRVPTDPVVEAHCRRLEAEGRNPFQEYMLPQAVLRFRQGFGRLIRTGKDRGMVLVLDGRLNTKTYKGDFFRSLPQCTRRRGPWAKLVEDGLRWLREGPPP